MENDEMENERFSFQPVELLVLEDRWNKGKLNKYKPLVQKFINEQQEIVKNDLGPDANDDRLVRRLLELLLTNGTLDLASEMLDQKDEILRECWIRAEQGDDDTSRIAKEWIIMYADNWRRWRVLVYTFIAVKCAVDIYRDIDSAQLGDQLYIFLNHFVAGIEGDLPGIMAWQLGEMVPNFNLVDETEEVFTREAILN